MTSTLMTAISFFRHHGRVSSTSYAVFSASINALNTFDPAHIASNAPTDMRPGAFFGVHDVRDHTADQRPALARNDLLELPGEQAEGLLLVPDEAQHGRHEQQEREQRKKEVVRGLRGQTEEVVVESLTKGPRYDRLDPIPHHHHAPLQACGAVQAQAVCARAGAIDPFCR